MKLFNPTTGVDEVIRSGEATDAQLRRMSQADRWRYQKESDDAQQRVKGAARERQKETEKQQNAEVRRRELERLQAARDRRIAAYAVRHA